MRAFLDNLRLALGTFLGNPLRSLLTLVGIVIGVATVITMMALIEGLRERVNRDLGSLGAHTFEVTKWPSGFGRINWAKYAKRQDLHGEDVKAILEGCPSVGSATPRSQEWGKKLTTAWRETNASVSIVGTEPTFLETSGVSVTNGRFFNETETLDGRPVVVIGVDVADVLFPGMDPVGSELRLQGRPFQVIGVLQKRGSVMGMASQDNQAIVPMRAFQQFYGSRRSVEIDIQARDGGSFQKAQDEVVNLLRRRRGLTPQEANDFEVHTNESMTASFNDLAGHRAGGRGRVPAVAGGGRHRHPEHHADVGDGADAGDWNPQGAGRAAPPHPGAVRHGGGAAVARGRSAGAGARLRVRVPGQVGAAVPHERARVGGGAVPGHELWRGAAVRHLPGVARGEAGPGGGDARGVGDGWGKSR